MHEACQKKSFKEIYLSRRPAGEKSVEEQLFIFIQKLIGKQVWEKIEEKFTEDVFKGLGTCIRGFKPTSIEKVNLQLSYDFIDFCIDLAGVNRFEEIIRRNHTYNKDMVGCVTNRLRLDAKLFKSFFEKTIKEIVHHVEKILLTIKGITAIFMVGGFSECKLVQDAIRCNSRNLPVIAPDSAEQAVLMGAVYYGHIHDACFKMSSRASYASSTLKKGIHLKQVNDAFFI